MDDAQPANQRPNNLLILAVGVAALLAVIAGGYFVVRGTGDGSADSSENPRFEIDGYEFVRAVGRPTIPNAPVDIATAPDGRIYVADLGLGQVLAYTRDGELDSGWGQDGLSEEIDSPAQIALDSAGNIFVLELNSFDVTVLDQNGEQAAEWSAAPTDDATSLGGPSSLAVSEDTVYLLDQTLGQIRRYSTGGDELEPWELPDAQSIDIAAGAGSLALLYRDSSDKPGIRVLDANGETTTELPPDGLAAEIAGREPSAVAITGGGEVVALLDPVSPQGAPGFAVVDPGSGAVQIIGTVGPNSLPAVNSVPVAGLAVTVDGRFLIPNPARQQVGIYSRAGALLGTLAPQSLDGRFAGLGGIAAGSEGNIYAVDPGLSRVIEFRPDGSVAQVYDFSEGRVPHFQTGFTRQRAQLAVSPTGDVYVGGAHQLASGDQISDDSVASPLVKFDSSGAIIDPEWGGAGRPGGPRAVNAMMAGPDGQIYLVDDRAANEVRVFTPDGDDRGPLIEPFWSGSIQDVAAVEAAIYTVELDAGSSVVRAFSPAGDYLGAIAELSGSAETANRTGFALAPVGDGNLFVATSNVLSGADSGPQFEYALHRLDEEGNLTKLGELEIPFTTLPDIATAPDGTLYIATPNDHRIYVYRPTL